jgi:ribosomal protein L11 methyltransferase
MTSAPAAFKRSSFVARFDAGEQTAHKLLGAFAERVSGDDVAVSLTDAGRGRWQVALHFRTAPDDKVVRAAVAAAAGGKAAAALHVTRVQPADWVRESLAGLAPVAAGRFVVHGAHDRAHVPVNRIGIEIEAGLAFGTGHHGTTHGCLLALDRICRSPRLGNRTPRILDLGTGSGVLAIAAARALHVRVAASDVDAAVVRVARTNARLNRAGPLVEIVRADGLTARSLRQRAPFDLVFANILLGPLLRLAVPLRRRLGPGARLVLSGLLAAQANAAIAAYRPLVLERRIAFDGWVTLVFRRPMA